MAWTFLMTLPGVPLIYCGDELGMQGAGDPDNRLPMLFGASLSLEQQETLEHVRALGLVRQAHEALRRGVRQQLQMDADGLFWAYSLKDGGDVCVVAFNRTASAQTRSVSVSALGVADGVVFEEALGGATSAVAGGILELEGRLPEARPGGPARRRDALGGAVHTETPSAQPQLLHVRS